MSDSSAPWLAPFERRYVEKSLEIKGWDDLAPYYERLSEKPLETPEALKEWLSDWSELSGVADEFVTRRYIEMTCHTDDEEKKQAYLYCVREVEPKLSEWSDRLNRKFLASPVRDSLDRDEYGRLERIISTSVELFDEKNIPLQIKLQELSQSYQALIGGMTVEFEGRERTLPEMAKYLHGQDRPKREKAFRLTAERRLKDKDRLEEILDEMLVHRAEWAENLKLADYREYCFKSKLRDYTPEDCHTFHDAIEKTAVPLARKITLRRREEMGLPAICPWDTACDPLGRPPLKPFEEAGELFEGVGKVFTSVDGRLGEMFESIGFSMDLESRKGKAPGGYQATLSEARVPFIFTNAVGVQGDVNTLLHEGGHAFHTLQSRSQPLIWYRHAAMEFSEVASMTMELVGGDRLEPFYEDEERRARAKRERLESIVSLFPWVAQVDAFQHWIYTNPGHGREERAGAWLDLSRRFSTGVDWSQAPEGALENLWHRQLHIFELPFYYIEYAIAQLGALQIYRRYREDADSAVDGYLRALSLGGSRTPAELFEAAGARLDFSENLLGELMDFIERELGL